MSQQKVSNSNINPKCKVNKMYNEFTINIIKFESKNDDSNDTNLFHLSLTDKTTKNNGQRYGKSFKNSDLNVIKQNIGFKKIKNEKLMDIILYSLSIKNVKYNIVYKIINTDNDHYIEINIEYDTGFFTMNIMFKIPAKLTDMDGIKSELRNTKKMLENKTKKLNQALNELKLIKKEFNDFKSNYLIDMTAIKSQLSGNKKITGNKRNNNSNDSNISSKLLNETKKLLNNTINDINGIRVDVNLIKSQLANMANDVKAVQSSNNNNNKSNNKARINDPKSDSKGASNGIGNGITNEVKNDDNNDESKNETEYVDPDANIAKKKLNWMFQSNHQIIVNADNGKAAQKPKYKSGTIKFTICNTKS